MWCAIPSIFAVLLGFVTSSFELPVLPVSQDILSLPSIARKDAKVLILGGGVSGVVAARTLHEQGISDFLVVEARHELGGRLMSHSFGSPGRRYTVELGANWVQGTQSGYGPENPIWSLAKKHNVSTRPSHYVTSLTTYDDTGAVDYLDVFDDAVGSFERLVASAGSRVPKRLVDMTARSGYSLTGAIPISRHAMASEYYQFDWEFGTTPEENSWLASSWAHNYTFSPDSGGFSDDNLFSIDERGFKALIQSEADAFIKLNQLRLNSTVKVISSSKRGVTVTLVDGTILKADYALCTFSLGVLQHGDVAFEPALPAWKQEAIYSMTMGTYTKIFLQFQEKFWFDTEMALYADYERGRYPIWQSLDHPDFLLGSGIIFVTVTGEYSKRIESLPDSQVQEEVLSVLRSMFPDRDVPEPLDFYFQRWHSDPLFRGAYSSWPASFLSEHQGNLRANVDERLWFAGEATSRKYFGFLHGAYAEGLDMGHTLAECIKGGGCLGLEHIEHVQNARPYVDA
ncbi:amine oxidase [Laetiporus sulphureus 93-53]|uniref:Amine oxidase n=1 Tax=Laetiporus sulphureus 93-53 TaxID=1314785 RepID=A0A165DLC2_9APHY|nr:amine oxidase [Laetiporus sulphureus 93-53]KZT05137.1 amine oxidase [Laetiporus sulphureus 93-53]